jgi:shikimate dehydrogenase
VIVDQSMRITGIMGSPIHHSLSPVIHNFWLRINKIKGVYIPLLVKPENLKEALFGCAALGFTGINVTVPHKEAALQFLDYIDPVATEIGAVNTIMINGEGKFEGLNTDCFGFAEAIQVGSKKDWSPSGKPVAVIGAGGAARSIIYALKVLNAGEIRIVNRTYERAESLASEFGDRCKVWNWRDRHDILEDTALLVNTTKCGMVGQPILELDLKKLPEACLVNDIVYAPLMTNLLRNAEARGNTIITGLEMLLHQARPAFKTWFGVDPDISDDLRTEVFSRLK